MTVATCETRADARLRTEPAPADPPHSLACGLERELCCPACRAQWDRQQAATPMNRWDRARRRWDQFRDKYSDLLGRASSWRSAPETVDGGTLGKWLWTLVAPSHQSLIADVAASLILAALRAHPDLLRRALRELLLQDMAAAAAAVMQEERRS